MNNVFAVFLGNKGEQLALKLTDEQLEWFEKYSPQPEQICRIQEWSIKT